MTVSRHDRRNRPRNICRQQLIAAALAHRVEIVVASFLQNILQGTRRRTRFGLFLQDIGKFESIAIGNIDSSQVAHIRPPIL